MSDARLPPPATPVARISPVCGRLLVGLSGFAAWMSLGALGFMALSLCGRGIGLHWTLTASVPPGLYRRTQAPLVRGQFVAFCLPLATAQFGWQRGYIQHVPDWPLLQECPHGYQPLLKPIAAVAGDVVELTAEMVRVNETSVPHSATHAQDRQGRPLPHWPWGRYQLVPGELWVMSTTRPNSWDSRYFGPIRAESVIATAKPVWVWPTAEAHR
jgi:conjugative transfer signal peptidase TraF